MLHSSSRNALYRITLTEFKKKYKQYFEAEEDIEMYYMHLSNDHMPMLCRAHNTYHLGFGGPIRFTTELVTTDKDEANEIYDRIWNYYLKIEEANKKAASKLNKKDK